MQKEQTTALSNPLPSSSIGVLTKDDLDFDFDLGLTSEDLKQIEAFQKAELEQQNK